MVPLAMFVVGEYEKYSCILLPCCDSSAHDELQPQMVI